jgi:hypothetical protein
MHVVVMYLIEQRFCSFDKLHNNIYKPWSRSYEALLNADWGLNFPVKSAKNVDWA